MSLSESALLALAGVALLVLLRWTRRIHLSRLEKAWLPPELHEAALIYREQVFRVRSPMLVVAKVDRGYRTGNGIIVLVEFKTRRVNRPYRSDIIELSAQRLAVQAQTGAEVADYGYVVIMLTLGGRKRAHRVNLMSIENVIAVARRREAILAGEAVPRVADSEGLCARCAFKRECDSAQE